MIRGSCSFLSVMLSPLGSSLLPSLGYVNEKKKSYFGHTLEALAQYRVKVVLNVGNEVSVSSKVSIGLVVVEGIRLSN